jgi:hypothetical protein
METCGRYLQLARQILRMLGINPMSVPERLPDRRDRAVMKPDATLLALSFPLTPLKLDRAIWAFTCNRLRRERRQPPSSEPPAPIASRTLNRAGSACRRGLHGPY